MGALTIFAPHTIKVDFEDSRHMAKIGSTFLKVLSSCSSLLVDEYSEDLVNEMNQCMVRYFVPNPEGKGQKAYREDGEHSERNSDA